MKTSRLSNSIRIFLGLAVLAWATGGCGKKAPPADTAFKSSGKPAQVAAEPNSFKEVTSYLDPGGSFYLYLGTEQWLNGLSTRMSDLREVLASLPNMTAEQRSNLRRVLDVLSGLVKRSGLEEVSGVGASGILVEKGMYHNKFMLHHHPGKNQGFLWSAFGQVPHPLAGLDYLPESTALASFFDLDIPLLWSAIQEQLQQAGIPDADKFFTQFPREIEKQTGLKWDQLLASLGGEVGIVLTLDEDREVTFPGPGGATFKLPEPALALMIKVKDDTIFSRLDPLISRNPQVIKTDKGELKMRTLSMRMPLPVRPTLADAGNYLFLASNDKIVEELLAVKSGKRQSLKATDEFKRLSQGILLQGNRFDFVSARLGRTVQYIVSTALFAQAQSGRSDGGTELLQRWLGEGQEHFSFTVASNLKEGWHVSGHSSQHPAAAFLAPTLVAPAAILAGVTLPALARAKERAQTIACVNNLKQIGLAARMYANDHGEVLPKDFVTMKNELASPKILVCPGDKSKTPAPDWSSLTPAHVSYEIVSPVPRANEAQEVYARCPIHGSACFVDGSVQQGRSGQRPTRRRN